MSEHCHSSSPPAQDIRLIFSPHCGIVEFFLALVSYLAEMKKSKQNQLTGGEVNPGASLRGWTLLLCSWGPYTDAAGTEEEGDEDRSETGMWAGGAAG